MILPHITTALKQKIKNKNKVSIWSLVCVSDLGEIHGCHELPDSLPSESKLKSLGTIKRRYSITKPVTESSTSDRDVSVQ